MVTDAMNLESIVSQIAQTIQREANVDAIFGQPRKLDEHVIIPVARIEIKLNGGGAGLGASTRGGDMGDGTEESEHGEPEMVGKAEKGEKAGKVARGEKGEKGETSGKGEKHEMSGRGEKIGDKIGDKAMGLLGGLASLGGKGSGVGGEFEIDVVPLGFIRDGKNGAEFCSIEASEGLLGKFEHLLKNLRSSGGNGRLSEASSKS